MVHVDKLPLNPFIFHSDYPYTLLPLRHPNFKKTSDN